MAAQHPDVVKRFEDFLKTARVDSRLWPIREQAPKKAAAKKEARDAGRHNAAGRSRPRTAAAAATSLKSAAAVASAAGRALGPARRRSPGLAATAVARLPRTLARPDGGYAWDDQARLAPDADLRRDRLLPPAGQEPPRPRQARPSSSATITRSDLKKLEQEHREFEFQQIQGLLWLGEDVSSFRDQVRGWTTPARYLPAVRAARLSRLPVRAHGVHLPRAARPAAGRPRAGVRRLPRRDAAGRTAASTTRPPPTAATAT